MIEYALEQNPSNWLSVTDNFGLPAQGSKDDLVNLPEGSYFTLRYKTSTSNSFTGVEYKTLDTLGPVNCSGDIEVRVALDACVNGTRNSVFYYRNKASTGAPAFFEIEYQAHDIISTSVHVGFVTKNVHTRRRRQNIKTNSIIITLTSRYEMTKHSVFFFFFTRFILMLLAEHIFMHSK